MGRQCWWEYNQGYQHDRVYDTLIEDVPGRVGKIFKLQKPTGVMICTSNASYGTKSPFGIHWSNIESEYQSLVENVWIKCVALVVSDI